MLDDEAQKRAEQEKNPDRIKRDPIVRKPPPGPKEPSPIPPKPGPKKPKRIPPQAKWRDIAERMLAAADIKINGSRAWDITVHKPELFEHVFKNYSLGLGEAYMDGWWDCHAIDEFFYRILRANLDSQILKNKEFLWPIMLLKLKSVKSFIINNQSRARALIVGQSHYDIGNDLYLAMLDQNLNYTCGYWQDSDNLDDAQIAKMELCCQKLSLQPGMHILDIGCGFGALAKYAAVRYGVSVVGITISKEQRNLAAKQCEDLPIDIRFQDYRELDEKFDRIVSLGMFEHVGYKNYQQYMQIAAKCLNDEGLFLLHTIGSNKSSTFIDPWINRYIFPNGQLPSIAQIGKAIEPSFMMEDWHNFGPDYAKTLRAWHANFVNNWPQLNKKYDDKFYRMWTYYLLSCAGTFDARINQLWQIVLAKPGRQERYISMR